MYTSVHVFRRLWAAAPVGLGVAARAPVGTWAFGVFTPVALAWAMPKLADDLAKAMNHHITEELAASHWYLAASATFQEAGLLGMSKWMIGQSEEERMHALRFLGHLQKRHAPVRLEQIPAPKNEGRQPQEVFEAALAVEMETTRRIHGLHGEAVKQQDVALRLFLDWFVQEQLEEEDTLRTILDRFKLAGTDKAALLLLDAELGARPPTPRKGE